MSKACNTCPSRKTACEQLGLDLRKWDHVVALAGNPNTGKSTLFNALTGLRQHTGNWPGKTVTRAEGAFSLGGKRFKIVDLPGTYSLLSASPDEEVARNFILFGQPDVTLIVTDATRLERNLNLVLQVLQITDRAVMALNLIDEARAHGLRIDHAGLATDLGIPVVPCAARSGEGIPELLEALAAVAAGTTTCKPQKLRIDVPGLSEAVQELAALLERAHPGIRHKEWIALRLLEGDPRILDAITVGGLDTLPIEEVRHAG